MIKRFQQDPELWAGGFRIRPQMSKWNPDRMPNRRITGKRIWWLVSKRCYRQLVAEYKDDLDLSPDDLVCHFPTDKPEEFTTKQLAEDFRVGRTGDVA